MYMYIAIGDILLKMKHDENASTQITDFTSNAFFSPIIVLSCTYMYLLLFEYMLYMYLAQTYAACQDKCF